MLTLGSAPPQGFGLVFMGPAQTRVPFGDGLRCVAGDGEVGTFRFPAQSTGSLGGFSTGPVVGLSQGFAPAGKIVAGSTWNFQAWYRDLNGPCGAGTNLSNALSATFVP